MTLTVAMWVLEWTKSRHEVSMLSIRVTENYMLR
jgi:hypothetical protein